MAFPAKFTGQCFVCASDIEQGDWLVNHNLHGYIHEDCAQDADNVPSRRRERSSSPDLTTVTLPRGKTARDRCDRCFQVPASNGVCGCL